MFNKNKLCVLIREYPRKKTAKFIVKALCLQEECHLYTYAITIIELNSVLVGKQNNRAIGIALLNVAADVVVYVEL